MSRLTGKRLLVLGTSVGSVDVVQYAKEQGAFVLVADYLPPEKSKAKQYADETSMCSTLDVDSLCALAQEYKIDGVFCGVSEANLQSANQVCRRLGLPTYYTQDQWNTFMKKDSFRKLCQSNGVSVPSTYFTGTREQLTQDLLNQIKASSPVIIKPVDNGANVGVSVCKDPNLVDAAVEYAFSKSKAGRIIIEQFVEGVEVSLTYCVQNGLVKLVCMGTKFTCDEESGLVSHAYIFPPPGPCLEEYLHNVDENVKRMILGQGLDNCTLFFQGIYSDHRFYIFEAGLRMQGTASFRITKRIMGQSHMEFMVDNALGAATDYDIHKEDPSFNGRKCVIFSQLSNGGKIAKVEGFEEAAKLPVVVAAEQRYQVGDTVINDGTLRQIVFRYVLQDDDVNEIISAIKHIQKTVKTYHEDGEEGLLNCFDPELLR